MTQPTHPTKFILYSLTLGVCICLLTLLNIVFSAQVSTTGEKLKFLTDYATIIKKENQQLESELLTVGSLNHLEQKATQLGFTIKAETVFVPNDAAVALKPEH